MAHNLIKEELNASHFLVEITWNSNLNILIFIKILLSESEEMFVEVLGSIVGLLPAEYLIHIEVESADESAPVGVVEAGAGDVLVLVDVARLVVVALVEHIHCVVSPLVILVVVSVILVLYGLFVWLREGLGHGLGRLRLHD